MKFNTIDIIKNRYVLITIIIIGMMSFASNEIKTLKNNKGNSNSLIEGKEINIKKLNKLIGDLSKNIDKITTKPNSTGNKYETIVSSEQNEVYRYKTSHSNLVKTNIKTLNTKLKCPIGTALNGFHLSESSYKSRQKNLVNKNIYEFNCYKHKLIMDKFHNFKTKKIALEKNDFKNSNVNKLLQLKINCPEAQLLTKFRIAFTAEKQIFYRYQCVESDVDDEVCESSESNRVKIPEEIKKMIKKGNKKTEINKKNNQKANEKTLDINEKKGIKNNADKKTGDKNKKNVNEKISDIYKKKGRNEEVKEETKKIISLEILKKLIVDAPTGKFIRFFKLKLDEAKNEVYYKIKSCLLIQDPQEENDSEYELEEEEVYGEPELQEEEEKEIMNLPEEVFNKANKLNSQSYKNGNLEIEPENENEEFNKKYQNYELITIGKVPNKAENSQNNRNEDEND